MSLNHLARVEHLRSDAESRAAEYFNHVPDDAMIRFAADVMDGTDISGWISQGTSDELLRALAYATLMREVYRREEIAALED